MKNHTREYMNFFGYDVSDFMACEICGSRAVDVHHIDSRKMGGSNGKDVIENLMGLCREDHLVFGDLKQHVEFLRKVHAEFMKDMTPWHHKHGDKVTL